MRRGPNGRVSAMKIKYRIGVMPGPWPAGPEGADLFWKFVDTTERSDID